MEWKRLLNRTQKIVGMLTLASLSLNACLVAVDAPEPPPPHYGVIGYAPGPGFVWIDGYWDLRGGAWVWAPGYWGRPPRVGAVWVPHRWVRGPRGRWRFRQGGWR